MDRVDEHDLVEPGVVEGQPVVGDEDGLGVGDAGALDHVAGAVDELGDDVGTDDVPTQRRHQREEATGSAPEVQAAVRRGEVFPHDRHQMVEHGRIRCHGVRVEAMLHAPEIASLLALDQVAVEGPCLLSGSRSEQGERS